MQYESNRVNGFGDIRKRNTDAQTDMVMTIPPAPTSWAGDKNLCAAKKKVPYFLSKLAL